MKNPQLYKWQWRGYPCVAGACALKKYLQEWKKWLQAGGIISGRSNVTPKFRYITVTCQVQPLYMVKICEEDYNNKWWDSIEDTEGIMKTTAWTQSHVSSRNSGEKWPKCSSTVPSLRRQQKPTAQRPLGVTTLRVCRSAQGSLKLKACLLR